MKTLLANDLHANRDNLTEFEKNWNEMLDVCAEQHIDEIHIGGDLFDSPTVQYLPVMQMVLKCMDKAKQNGITLYISPGNHDLSDRKLTDSWIDCFKESCHVVKQPTLFELDNGLCMAQFPYYLEDSIMPDVLKRFEEKLDNVDVHKSNVFLYLHAGVHGALGDFDVPNELPQKLLKDYRAVLCAHYHNRVHIKGTSIYYIGASRAHNFGEDENKGYTIIDSEESSFTFVKNEVNTRYVTERLDVSDVKNWKNTYDDRYKIRLIIHCQSDKVDTVDKQALFDKGVNKIEFDTEKIQAIRAEQSGIEEKFDSKDLQQEYKSFCKEKEFDNKMGLKYLNEI